MNFNRNINLKFDKKFLNLFYNDGNILNQFKIKKSEIFVQKLNSLPFVFHLKFFILNKFKLDFYPILLKQNLFKEKIVDYNFIVKNFFYKSVYKYKKISYKKYLYRCFLIIQKNLIKNSIWKTLFPPKNNQSVENIFLFEKNLLFSVMDCLVLQFKALIDLLKQINSLGKLKQLEFLFSQSFCFTYSFIAFEGLLKSTISTKNKTISTLYFNVIKPEIFFYFLKRQINLKLKLNFLKAIKWKKYILKEKTFIHFPFFSNKSCSYNSNGSTQLEKFYMKLSSISFMNQSINRKFLLLKKNCLNQERAGFYHNKDVFFSFFPVHLIPAKNKLKNLSLNFKTMSYWSQKNKSFSLLNCKKNVLQKLLLSQKSIIMFFLNKKNGEFSKNLLKIGCITKKKFFLELFFFKCSKFFLNTKIVLFYFLLELITLVHKKLMQKQKKYFKLKEKAYITTKFQWRKRYEFIHNLLIKRENYCFSLNKTNIVIFSEKLSFFTQLIFLTKIITNYKIFFFKSFEINHSLYQTRICFSTKPKNFVINGLQIKYFYKKIPEYSKNINIKKKLFYSVLFIKKEFLSQVSTFIILCDQSGPIKNWELNLLIFKQKNSNFFYLKNPVQKTIVYFYNPFLFSNKLNRKQISNFKSFHQLYFVYSYLFFTLKPYFSFTSFFLLYTFFKDGTNSVSPMNKSFLLNNRGSLLLGTKYSSLKKKHTWPITAVEIFPTIFFETNIYKNSILNIFPSPENVRIHLKKVKKIIQQSSTKTQKQLIFKLSLEIQIWCSLYKNMATTKIFDYCNYITFKYLWRWACKRHPNKSKSWIKNKYFHRVAHQSWVFAVLQTKTNSMYALKSHV